MGEKKRQLQCRLGSSKNRRPKAPEKREIVPPSPKPPDHFGAAFALYSKKKTTRGEKKEREAGWKKGGKAFKIARTRCCRLWGGTQRARWYLSGAERKGGEAEGKKGIARNGKYGG